MEFTNQEARELFEKASATLRQLDAPLSIAAALNAALFPGNGLGSLGPSTWSPEQKAALQNKYYEVLMVLQP